MKVGVASVYAPRYVLVLDTARTDNWSLKVYWVTPEPSEPDQELADAAIARSLAALEGAPGYGAGFLIVHRGEMATWAILWWWTDQDILRRKIWQVTDGGMVDVGDQDYVACVWELSIVDWERKAWINHILRHPRWSHADGYLTALYPSSFC